MIKMKSTGGLRKHIRHQTAAVCGNRLWKTEYHDFPGKTLTSSVTLTTVRQMKRKAGLAVEETTASVKAGEGYEITRGEKVRTKTLRNQQQTKNQRQCCSLFTGHAVSSSSSKYSELKLKTKMR